MSGLRRSVTFSSSPLNHTSSRICRCSGRVTRRFASSEHGQGHGHDHGSSKESLGKGLYITLAAIPTSLALYKFSRSGDDNSKPILTRIIEAYKGYEQRWLERNSLHTKMIEQAAHDRNLFHNSPGSATIDLRFPEIFNTGSPYNVPAGHGGGNIDHLIAHYEKRNRDVEEAKLRALAEREKKEKQ
ncbi:MAG: hypothetical protein M4579_003970 [Chaenotheca gracillima]|nr:MAG: hypothetical protein M4579_003970 [Chaenotheca gracillima]